MKVHSTVFSFDGGWGLNITSRGASNDYALSLADLDRGSKDILPWEASLRSSLPGVYEE